MEQIAKTVLTSALPLFLIVLIILYLKGRQQTGVLYKGLMTVFVIYTLLLTSPAVTQLLALPLFAQVPENTNQRADAIVVLGGADTKGSLPTYNAIRRIEAGMDVLHSGRAPVIVFSGSPRDRRRDGEPQPYRFLEVLAKGYALDRDKTFFISANNTYEEATGIGKLLTPKNVKTLILVSHEHHIPRAVKTFAAQGFKVISHSIRSPRFTWNVHPKWQNLDHLWSVIHEYAGLAIYRWRGWMTA